MPVITFDFHNTIANCDPWFDLEVRDLPWAVLARLGFRPTVAVNKAGLDMAYAALRRRVIDSGDEIDAFDSVVDILRAHDIVLDRPVLDRTVDELMTGALESLEPVQGVAETIRYLRARDCRLGVISSAVHHQFVEWSLCRMDLSAAFSSVVTSASAGYYKSSPRIYEHSLRELNTDPGNAVHVGDSLRWDVSGAKQAGMSAIWLNTGRFETRTTTPSMPVAPDLIISSMVDAGPIVYAFATEAGQIPHD